MLNELDVRQPDISSGEGFIPCSSLHIDPSAEHFVNETRLFSLNSPISPPIDLLTILVPKWKDERHYPRQDATVFAVLSIRVPHGRWSSFIYSTCARTLFQSTPSTSLVCVARCWRVVAKLQRASTGVETCFDKVLCPTRSWFDAFKCSLNYSVYYSRILEFDGLTGIGDFPYVFLLSLNKGFCMMGHGPLLSNGIRVTDDQFKTRANSHSRENLPLSSRLRKSLARSNQFVPVSMASSLWAWTTHQRT